MGAGWAAYDFDRIIVFTDVGAVETYTVTDMLSVIRIA